MKRILGVPSGFIVAAVFLIGLFAGAMNAECGSHDAKPAKAQAAGSEKAAIEVEDLVVVRATVEEVDLAQRVVRVRGPMGNVVRFKVDESAKNLDQVKAGDTVKIEYLESVAVEALKPGEKGAAPTQQAAVVTARPGEKPSGVVTSQLTVTATIEAMNKAKPSVTLKGPYGDVVEVTVRHREYMDRFKVGDTIEITYTEALALSVEKAD